jgi:hypothetical protein
LADSMLDAISELLADIFFKNCSREDEGRGLHQPPLTQFKF